MLAGSQREHAVVLEQDHGLRREVVSGLPAFRGIQVHRTFLEVDGVGIQQAAAGLDREGALDRALKRRLAHAAFGQQLRQVAVGRVGIEFQVVAGVDGVDGALLQEFRAAVAAALLHGAVIADDDAVVAQIIPEDDVEQGVAADGVLRAELVVAGHDASAARLPDDGFVRKEDFLIDLLLRQGRAPAIAQEVLGGGGHALAEILGLQALDKGGAHGGRQIAVLAVGLLHAGPVGAADDVHHRRQGELLAQVAHRAGRLPHFHGQQRRVPGAGDGHLLGIGRGALGGDARDALVMDDGRDAGGGMVDQIILDVGDELAELVRIQALGTGQLADMAGAVRNHFLALVKGKDTIDHQLARVDAEKLGRAVLHGKAVIDGIDQRLVLFIRIRRRPGGTSHGQQDGRKQ